jgi:hypothetical protein
VLRLAAEDPVQDRAGVGVRGPLHGGADQGGGVAEFPALEGQLDAVVGGRVEELPDLAADQLPLGAQRGHRLGQPVLLVRVWPAGSQQAGAGPQHGGGGPGVSLGQVRPAGQVVGVQRQDPGAEPFQVVDDPDQGPAAGGQRDRPERGAAERVPQPQPALVIAWHSSSSGVRGRRPGR